jgi:hypothetical protein
MFYLDWLTGGGGFGPIELGMMVLSVVIFGWMLLTQRGEIWN